MRQHQLEKNIALLGISLFLTTATFANGIRINLENISDLGNAYAGGAALTDDVSINSFNAAGLSFVHKHQLIFGGAGVNSRNIFTGTSAAPNAVSPFLIPPFFAKGRTTSNVAGVIPSIYYNYPLATKWDLGIGFNAPFGLGLKYGEEAPTRYALIKAFQDSINILPSVAYRYNDNWSFGIGPNFEYYRALADVKVNTSVPAFGFADSRSHSVASGWGYGYHLGAMYNLCDTTKVGLAYRSQIANDLSGKSSFRSGVLGFGPTTTVSHDFRLKFMLPPNTMLSVYQVLTSKWAVMGTVDFTQWNVYKTVKAKHVAENGTTTNVNTAENFRNAWHMAVAANYHVNPKIMLRFGTGYDQVATKNRFRSLEFPNGSVLALSVGARYMPSDRLMFDAGFLHSFLRKVPINMTDPTTFVSEKGKLKTYSDVLGAQVVINI